MDVDRLRAEFPILSRNFHGHPLAYLDSAATSQKPRTVIESEARYYTEMNSNVHRGAYELAEEATNAYEDARARVARFVHAADPSEIVFTRGTTESINLVANALVRGRLHRNDRVVTTEMDHHSNIVPWHLLRVYHGIDLEFAKIDDEGRLSPSAFEAFWDGRTKVVTIPQVSNVLGTIVPVREIADAAHRAGALVVVDAAQSAPHFPIDVRALGADFLAFSGHKTLGPTGIGVLWGRKALLDELPPWMGGGQMIERVQRDRITYRDPPARFEAGTPNISGAIALTAALDFLEGVGWSDLADHERKLARQFIDLAHDRLGKSMMIHGPSGIEGRIGVFSFTLKGVHAHDIGSLLDAEGIAVRAGQHCAQILMERFGVPAMVRASPYLYNIPSEIERLFDTLVRIRAKFSPTPVPAAGARAAR
ncbi:MAG: aminotransferase class V-fold PLP-dependent enzyme [Thermoplasmata archaeon]